MEKQRKEHRLIVIDSDRDIHEVDLNAFRRSRVSFGRDSSNQIVLKSGLISNTHGCFEYIEGELYIYDNNSTNGIYINNSLLKTDRNGESEVHRMKNGDIIRIDDRDMTNGHNMGVMMLYTTIKSSGSWKKTIATTGRRMTIGRNPQCDVYLDSPSVSRMHAAIDSSNGQMYIEDLNSSNGVFVNNKKVTGRSFLREKDIITIANSIIFYTAGMLIYKSNMGGTRVDMMNVSRVVTVKHQKRFILQDVNLTVEPNDFIAIIGGSGAGKSTVMNAMSGFEQATSGSVFVNGTDLYRNYMVLKNMIGYVPQQDIIYDNITLQKMLEYSAKMRMSEDLSAEERSERVDEVLSMVELEEHRDKFVRSLSGGQRKRASIAVELLADPGLFFLDEPTSGLDPGTEESFMKTLNTLSKHKGKTIIMVTHTTQNLHLCDKILFMGKGGRICFYGSPTECMDFFNVDNLTEIYNKALTDEEVAYWNAKYINEYAKKPQTGVRQSKDIKAPKKASFFRQFGILSARYITLIKNDMMRLAMIFLQPIIITLLLLLVAEKGVFIRYTPTQSILFAMSCGGIWVGLFNSIQEVCKERHILKREYMTNLRLGAYVLSKFAVQLLISILQGAIMIGIFTLKKGFHEDGIIMDNPLMEMIVTMILTIFSSSSIALVVSSIAKSNDLAMTTSPFLLMIQLLFSGILFPLKGIKEKISHFTISKWSVSAFGSVSNLNELEPVEMVRAKDVYDHVIDNVIKSWSIMGIFVVVCFIACIIILRSVSKDSR